MFITLDVVMIFELLKKQEDMGALALATFKGEVNAPGSAIYADSGRKEQNYFCNEDVGRPCVMERATFDFAGFVDGVASMKEIIKTELPADVFIDEDGQVVESDDAD